MKDKMKIEEKREIATKMCNLLEGLNIKDAEDIVNIILPAKFKEIANICIFSKM
jgi:hypothetical protein